MKKSEFNNSIIDNEEIILDRLIKDASLYRQSFKIPVIGITGSYGKTSVKEIISQVVNSGYNVHKTQGSQNSNRAILKSVMAMKREHNICVFELGVDGPGQMKGMVELCKPTIPVFTGICESHIGKLGSIRNIYDEKSHILDSLPPNGKIIANADDEALMEFLASDKRVSMDNVFTYGSGTQSMMRAEIIRNNGAAGSKIKIFGENFSDDEFIIDSRLAGLHNAANLAAGVLMGVLFKIPKEYIVNALNEFEPLAGRCMITKKNDIILIDDCYNAAPKSVEAALELLNEAKGRRVAILGDMLELGEESLKIHERIGKIAGKKTDLLICIGKEAKHIAKGGEKTANNEVYYFENIKDFLQAAGGIIKVGDTVLVKASHKMNFSEIVSFVSQQTHWQKHHLIP